QGHLTALVPDHPAGRSQVQAVQLPQPPVPEIEAFLISVHLRLDDLEVDGSGLLGWELEVDDVAAHPIEDPALELEEIGVDAHPVARVFPPRGEEVFPLERPGWTAAGRRRARRTGRISSLLGHSPRNHFR